MDNGKITGSDGKEADARNCVLIPITQFLVQNKQRKMLLVLTLDVDGEYGDEEFRRSLQSNLETGLTVL